jgi:hypothetical protein
MDVWRGVVGFWKRRFMAAVVIGGDGFGVGSVSVLDGVCTVMSKRWSGDGPSDCVEMRKCGIENGNE